MAKKAKHTIEQVREKFIELAGWRDRKQNDAEAEHRAKRDGIYAAYARRYDELKRLLNELEAESSAKPGKEK